MQEEWEGEGNQSYMIDQKSHSSREQNRYQNLKVMNSLASL